MHLELQQPTNCNLTVLISSAEITFGKIVIQALMASSVRPPRNEQVVLPTSQYHQPSLAKLAQPSQKGQVLNLGRSHEFGRNIKRASTNVGGVQARPLRYSCRACPSNINPWNAYYPLAKVDRLMDGPILAAWAAASEWRRRAGGLVCRSEMRLQFIRKSSAGRPYGPILHSAVVCHLGPNLHGNLLFLSLARLFE